AGAYILLGRLESARIELQQARQLGDNAILVEFLTFVETAVMRELGIDISGHRSKGMDEFTGQSFDYVLTVCDDARETCPIFPGHGMHIHHSFDDPAAVQEGRGTARHLP